MKSITKIYVQARFMESKYEICFCGNFCFILHMFHAADPIFSCCYRIPISGVGHSIDSPTGVQSGEYHPKIFWLRITSNSSICHRKIPFVIQASIANLDQEFPETVHFQPFWPTFLFQNANPTEVLPESAKFSVLFIVYPFGIGTLRSQ